MRNSVPFGLFLSAALLLTSAPAHAFWKELCGQISRMAGYSLPPPKVEPPPWTNEIDTRLARLFRQDPWAGPDLPDLAIFETWKLALLNAELIRRASDPRGVQTFIQGAPAERLFLITHQTLIHQAATAAYLARPEYSSIPRLGLTGDEYPIGNRDLLRQLSLLQVSHGGEMYGITIDTAELHLAGGFCEFCLSISANQAVTSLFSRRERRHARILLHASISYTSIDSNYTTLKDLKRKIPADEYQREEQAIVQGFLPDGEGWTRLRPDDYLFENPTGQRLTVEIIEN